MLGRKLGNYYLETGFGIRASKVIYDRRHSAITKFGFDSVDLNNLLEGYTWLHLSGITLALSEGCRKLVLNSLHTVFTKYRCISGDRAVLFVERY